jgi:triacylglycerol lipase
MGLSRFCPYVVVACAAACDASTVPYREPGSTVTTGVNGATSSATGMGGAHSTGAGHLGGGGAGGEAGLGPPYPIVLAHGFFGFEEFAGADFATYYYEVKQDLADHGEDLVFTPAVDPFNDSTVRGAQLLSAIEDVLARTGHQKVVLIGHSQGGLDARVVAHDRPELVAAVITVATPHEGTPVADVVLQLIDDPAFEDVLNEIVNVIGAPLYDALGEETAVTKPLHLFSAPGIAAFNAAYPDAPDVFYASIAGRTDMSLGGQDCAPDVDLPFIDDLSMQKDPVDALLWVSEAIVDEGGEFPNDGLVRAADARRGEFWGCVPADHIDEVGHLFGGSPGVGNPFEHKSFYRALVAHVRTLGY